MALPLHLLQMPMKAAVFNSLLALVLWLSTLGSYPAPAGPSSQLYCNGRFHYCLDYPELLFRPLLVSPLEEKMLLTTFDSLGSVTVVGTETGYKLDSFEQRLRPFSESGVQPTIVSIINGDDYYEVNFLHDGYWYHQKAGFFPTYDVLYTAKVPLNRTERMMEIKKAVSIEF
jgi:hypothetical protein